MTYCCRTNTVTWLKARSRTIQIQEINGIKKKKVNSRHKMWKPFTADAPIVNVDLIFFFLKEQLGTAGLVRGFLLGMNIDDGSGTLDWGWVIVCVRSVLNKAWTDKTCSLFDWHLLVIHPMNPRKAGYSFPSEEVIRTLDFYIFFF